MPLHTLSRGNRRFGLLDYSTDTGYLFVQNNSSLSGFTTGGTVTIDGSIGNPVPSFSVAGGAYAYNSVPGYSSVKNTTYNLQMYANGGTSLCNFFFGCSSFGVGQMWRLECRGFAGGFMTTSGWGTWSGTPAGSSYTPATWYQIRIVITSTGLASAWVNGVPDQQNYSIADNGGYFSFSGDGGNGGHFQDLVVTYGS